MDVARFFRQLEQKIIFGFILEKRGLANIFSANQIAPVSSPNNRGAKAKRLAAKYLRRIMRCLSVLTRKKA